jgi:hypothetical protein
MDTQLCSPEEQVLSMQQDALHCLTRDESIALAVRIFFQSPRTLAIMLWPNSDQHNCR